MSDSPEQPDFWNDRYAADRLPWDFGGVPKALREFLAAPPGPRRQALIPGCGTGHEIEAFASRGYAVTAIDFSPLAVRRALERFGHLEQRIVEGDFLGFVFADAPFDLIYERTFLCALPPARWPQVARRFATLLQPAGRLVGFFYFGAREDGPPFGLSSDEPAALLGEWFTLLEDQPVTDSLPLFAGGERWQVWQRNDVPLR